MITSFGHALRLRRDGKPRPQHPRNRAKPRHGDAQRDGRRQPDSGNPPLEPFDVQREPRNERDQRRRQAVHGEQLPRHRFGDDVAEIGSDQQTEQQVAGQPRKAKAPQEFAGHQRDDQREPECQRRAPRILRGAGPICRIRIMAPSDEGDGKQADHPDTRCGARTSAKAWTRSCR